MVFLLVVKLQPPDWPRQEINFVASPLPAALHVTFEKGWLSTAGYLLAKG